MKQSAPPGSALRLVERFLAEHPTDRLWVCTGYLSAYGLGVLGRLAPDRPIDIVTTELQVALSTEASASSVSDAVALLRRRNVNLYTWHRPERGGNQRSDMHAKAYITAPGTRSQAALVGSANLTWTGLLNNEEMMAAVEPGEVARLVRQTERLMRRKPVNADAIRRLQPKPARRTRKQAADKKRRGRRSRRTR